MNWNNLSRSNNNQSCCIHAMDDVPYITFSRFTTDQMLHGFSTRLGGVSEGIFTSMNLSFTRGDEKAAVMENFKRIGKAIGFSYEDLVLSDQTHTTNIHVVTSKDRGKGIIKPSELRDIDGLVTNVRRLPLATFYADCVPLYFHDPVAGVVALAHSGWRGTVARIGQCMVAAMTDIYDCQKQNIKVAIGPSICKDCYEVSEDVASEFQANFEPKQCASFLADHQNGKYHLDLWQVNQIILEEAGIPAENIEVTDLCTCCNPDVFFSHRASQGKRGNLAAFIMLE